MQLSDFRTVINQYDVIFFDAYGVLKTYEGLVPGVDRTFDLLEEQQKEFYIITNDASRSPELLSASYLRSGLTAITPDRIISSGMLAKEFLDLKVNDGIVAYLGTPGSAHYIDSSGLHTLPVSEIDDSNMHKVNALVMLDDEGYDWFRDLNKAVNLLRHRTIPAIAANPDNSYPINNHDVGIAVGALAHMMEKVVGKKFIRFGKPDSQIFMFAFEKLKEKREISKKKILMIGDTLTTDILGGNRFGLDTMLVLTGNTQPRDAESRIVSTGIVPTYICESAVV
ncbi:MAG TPA: TIGR01459 family HAD-type hydrolase [Phnomibacter sp.]|nr:TIGR01459 family HAD-type hydrolase [Phnomibacter sp.]